jgi:hypothetical protein
MLAAGALGLAASLTVAAQPTRAKSAPEVDVPLAGVVSRETPYAPLVAVIGGGSMGSFTDDQIRQIAATWRMVNSHGGMLSPDDLAGPPSTYWAGPSSGRDEHGRTIGERLKAVAPGFILSNYRNGSYIAQNSPWEAAEVESRFPTGISIWNTGCTLVDAVGAEDTRLSVTRFPADKIPVRPEIRGGRPEHYPFKASTAASGHSRTTKEYVAWIRLGDELMRIERIEVLAGRLEFTVRRGLWQTAPAAHAAGATVFQPVYIGRNMGIDAGDGALGGRPDDPSRQPGIRYGLMTFDPRMHEWLGEKAARIFAEDYDVCWLDVTVSTWYNNANAFGDDVRPWNLRANQPLTQDDYRGWQQEKNDALLARFPGKRFWINNVKGGVYFENGHDRYQLSGENGHRAVDGGSMEMYANHRGNEAAWIQTVAMTLDFVRSRFKGVAWSKGRNDQDYRRFSYATYLLAYEPGAELYFAIGEGGGLLSRPRALFYYDLGQPVQTFKTAAEAESKATKGLYTRDFAQGKILVNPGMEPKSLTLEKDYIDSATGKKVNAITLAGNSAAILLVAKK